jgi:hypothetical protein
MFGKAPGVADRIHAAVMIGGSVLICAYWIAFFLTDWTKPDFVLKSANDAPEHLRSVYMGFESAFPAADGFVALCFALAAFHLVRQEAKAVLFGLIGSGGLMFLALMDITFNVLHGFYARLGGDFGMQIEAAINVACVAGAVWTILRLWHHELRRG